MVSKGCVTPHRMLLKSIHLELKFLVCVCVRVCAHVYHQSRKMIIGHEEAVLRDKARLR